MKTIRNRELIQLALARSGKGSGSNLDLLRERSPDYGTAFSVPDLGEIRYLIVGGLAVSQYMPMRMTLDTDILIAKYDLAETKTLASRKKREKKKKRNAFGQKAGR